MSDPRLPNAASNAGKKVSSRKPPLNVEKKHKAIGPPPGKESAGATKKAGSEAAKKVGGKVAKKVGVPDAKSLTPKGLKAERDANKNTSAKAKTGKILKDTVKGATGKSAEGAVVGGGLQGAAVGLVKGVLTTTKGRWILALIFLPLLPVFLWISLLLGVGATVNSLIANNAQQTSSATTSTGEPANNLASIQDAAESSITPWELMAATVYYETGVGSNVAQTGGACPAGSAPDSICPSVVPLTASSAGSSSPSSTGTAATPTTSACVSSVGYVGVGIDCAVGRNGSVPATIDPSSTDYSTIDTADWACIRQAESGDAYNSASAPSGAYGILESTWVADGFSTQYGASQPYQATPAAQNAAALFILNNHPNSFYPGWDDACTINAPGKSPPPTISAIAPGVEVPGSYTGTALKTSASNPSSTSSGTCPAESSGPYCVTTTALPAASATSLSLSSEWFGTTLAKDLYKSKAEGNVSLLQGVNSNGLVIPTFDPTNSAAQSLRSAVVKALGMLPIANNSVTMDQNIYLLATDWAAGWSPQANQSCGTGGSQPTSLTVSSPTGTLVLTQGQLQLAEKIVNVAKARGANSSTEEAMIIDALTGSTLGQSSLYPTTGVFGNDITSVPDAVSQFLSGDKIRSASPAAQAATLGTSVSVLQPWSSAAALIVQSLTDTLPSCNYGSNIPNVPGGSPQAQLAVTTAKTEVGIPYVYGGGGTAGVGMGLAGYGAPACSGGFVVSTAIYGSGNPCSAEYATQTGDPGFDCSGLVQYSFGKAGVALPRTSQAQYEYVQAQSGISQDMTTMEPGDLLFYFPDSTGLPDHVVMFLGMVQTGTPTTSTVSSCVTSKVMSGLVELSTTCSGSPTGNTFTQTVTTFTPMIIQAPEEGSDVQIIPWYSDGFEGGGAAA